jgi:hypothetical protein
MALEVKRGVAPGRRGLGARGINLLVRRMGPKKEVGGTSPQEHPLGVLSVALLPIRGKRSWNRRERRKQRIREPAAPWPISAIVSRERQPRADIQTSTTLPCLMPPPSIGLGSRPSLPSLPSVQNLFAPRRLYGKSIVGFVHSPSQNLVPNRPPGWSLFRSLVASGFRDRSAATSPIRPSTAGTAKPGSNSPRK